MSRGLTPEEQRQIMRDVIGQGSDISPANPLQTFDAAVSPAQGTTSADGNPGGTTVIDTTRTEPDNFWNNMVLLITSGVYNGQAREITGWASATGTFTVSPAHSGQILAGVNYKVLAQVQVTADLTEVLNRIGDPSPQDLATIIGYEGATSLANKLTAARAALIDNLDALISSRLSTAHFDILEIEKSFAGNEHFVDISVVTADQSLGSETIDVVLPTGASIVAATAIAVIHIMNNAATLQKIDLDLEVDGNSVFSQDDVVGLKASDGDSAVFTIFQDVSAIVTATGDHTLEAKTTLSDAHSTHFTTQHGLIIAYKMS